MIFAQAQDLTAWEWFYKSEGVFFWPQLVLTLAALAHLIACLYLISRMHFLGSNPTGKMGKLERLILSSPVFSEEQKNIEEKNIPGCLLEKVISDGIANSKDFKSNNPDRKLAEEALSQAAESVWVSTDRRLGYLGLFSQVSMLIGLLGTVYGMVASFMVISQSNTAPPPRELASGVSQALLTTIVGLVVAIPTLWAHFHLKGKASRLQFELEKLATRFLEANYPDRAN